MDRDLALELLHVEAPPPTPPALSEFTPEVREMRVVAERLGIAIQFLAALNRSKYVPNELPRPRTARDTLAREYDAERHLRLVAQLLPHD